MSGRWKDVSCCLKREISGRDRAFHIPKHIYETVCCDLPLRHRFLRHLCRSPAHPLSSRALPPCHRPATGREGPKADMSGRKTAASGLCEEGTTGVRWRKQAKRRPHPRSGCVVGRRGGKREGRWEYLTDVWVEVDTTETSLLYEAGAAPLSHLPPFRHCRLPPTRLPEPLFINRYAAARFAAQVC